MAEYQITSWRDIPSMVVAREGDNITKVQLAARFQEAIDEAAMRLGEVGSDDYLAGWSRSAWISPTATMPQSRRPFQNASRPSGRRRGWAPISTR